MSQWEVVGGSDKGGILVRKGQDLKSEQCADRLSTGALVLRRVEMGEMGERHVRKLMDLIHVHAFKWEKLRCIMSEMFLIERFLVTCG
eukprot:symbB.v1.2.033475.t1/scaffold4133.1/size44188/3